MRGRRSFLAMLAAIVLLSPVRAQERSSAEALSVPYTMFTLPNGLTVILHEDHSVPQVAVNVWYHVGSAREQPGRTGLAHLFEHLMFEGSGHVGEGEFDRALEAAGASGVNGTTNEDRTSYFETVPTNALDLALFLESDRMGYFVDVVTPALVDGQRDVVKNERRESYENTPYGRAFLRLNELLYPRNHPYHWPVIGYMDDVSAATAEDVTAFFTRYYAPGNASLVVAGDIDPVHARRRIEYWFSDVKAGARVPPLDAPAVDLRRIVTDRLTDRVQLPRIFVGWLTPPLYHPGDAELDVLSGILSSGKTSRLYRRLVYELELAQDVHAGQYSNRLSSIYLVDVTARPSQEHPDALLARIVAIVDEELTRLRNEPPTEREMARVLNSIEASFIGGMETVAGKADRLNAYFAATGNPDYFGEDLARYRALRGTDIQAAVRRWLPSNRRIELSVVPEED